MPREELFHPAQQEEEERRRRSKERSATEHKAEGGAGCDSASG
jgi:hypothetical protein